nr:uncharacterized protein LOC111414845 [Onthophagus taurus]
MSHHGIPIELRSDNGKQFVSYEFKQFAKDYGFKSITSSPEYQQANGQAESAVKILKKIFRKNKDTHLALLIYRNTPLKCGFSPAHLLFCRRLREKVPTLKSKLDPKVPNHNKLRKEFEAEREKQKEQYNRRHRVRTNTHLEIGERVWIVNMQREGIVKEATTEPRSYIVETEREDIRRNRKHLQPLPTQDRDKDHANVEETKTENDKHITNEDTIVAEKTNNETEVPRRSERTIKVPQRLRDYIRF